MATIRAVAIMRANAKERLATALAIIGAPLGLEAPMLPIQGHDPTLIHAQQLEALADWVEKLEQGLSAQVVEVDEEFSDDELRHIAEALNYLPAGEVSRDELVARIKTALVNPPEGESITDQEAASLPDAEVIEPPDYATWTRKELEAEAERRGILSVTGTGTNGNVLVDDLRAALIADDKAAP